MRVDQIRAFRAELSRLQSEGVVWLPPADRERVRLYHDETIAELVRAYDVDPTEREAQLSWGMRVVTALGGLALCAAVFLFFNRFWGLFAVPTQVALLAAGPVIGVALTELAARRERTLYFAALAALVAFAAFVLDLTALGRLFAITPTPVALLAWALFALALAYGYGLRSLLAVGVACLTGFLAAELVTLAGAHWSAFPRRPETVLVTGGAVTGAALAAGRGSRPGFDPVLRGLAMAAVFLPVVALSVDGGLSFLPGRADTVEVGYQAGGFALAAAAIWLGVRRSWPEVVRLGTGFFVVLLYLRLYDWLWGSVPRYLFFLLIGLVAVACLALLKRLRGAGVRR